MYLENLPSALIVGFASGQFQICICVLATRYPYMQGDKLMPAPRSYSLVDRSRLGLS